MSWLFTILSSGGFGALLGLVGSYLTRQQEQQKQKVEHAHELKMRELDLQSMELENKHRLELLDKNIDLTKVEYSGKEDVTYASAFVESQKNADEHSSIKLVEIAKSMMRPVITVFLLVASTLVICQLAYIINGFETFDKAEVLDIFKTAILELIFITSTCVTWWFGSRPSNILRKR